MTTTLTTTNSYPPGYPTHLDCQECDSGIMNAVSGPDDHGDYVVRCDECEWLAHASMTAVDTGDWTD